MKKLLFTLIVLTSTIVLFAQPANDNCASATPIAVGVGSCTFTQYTNLNATNSGVADPGCGNYLGGDVWFSVTVPASGHLIFDTQTGAGTVTDAGMAIYSGTCASLTLIECDDDDSDNGLYMPKIDNSSLTPGSTVYIRVWEYGNNNNGTFDLCVYEPGGSGPCASVPTISCGATQSVLLSGNGDWNIQYCGTGSPGAEAIFAYTPTVSGPQLLTLVSNPDLDYLNFAYNTSCATTGWTCIGRTDQGFATLGPINLDAGVTYYFIVDNDDASPNFQNIEFYLNCPEVGGNYVHPTDGIQGTYNGACMVNTCSGTYVDDGNANPYSSNINGIYRTFCPDLPGKCMTAKFTMLDIDFTQVFPSGAQYYDYLIVRDGPTQGSSIMWAGLDDEDLGGIYDLAGSWPSDSTFISTDESGCLTFAFYSDALYVGAGWVAEFSCTDCGTSPTNNDCNTAIPICEATNLDGASPGPGLTSTCGGCNLSENYSSWYYFEITQSGRIALDLKAENFFEDYDFALYEAVDCTTLGDPVRCSYAMAPTYCRVASDNAAYYMSNVTANGSPGINNTTTYPTSFYSNYTGSLETEVNTGATLTVQATVVCPTGGSPAARSAAVMVWIDWNKDMDFLDAGEYYATTDSYTNGSTAILNIPVPATARPGYTAMRVMMNNSVVPQASVCTSITGGEVEDYALFINDFTHCSNRVKDLDETGVDCGGVDCVDCSASNWPTNTGMNNVATDVSEDVQGDSWVNWINVTAGESYFLMINNWSPGGSGFDLVFEYYEGAAMDCSILPIELASFETECINGEPRITWSTYSETNNDYFVLLKSYDGITYNAVDTIDGAGNSNSLNRYEISYH